MTCLRQRCASAHALIVASAVSTVVLSAPIVARADYRCAVLDVPGAAWQQIWQINDAGQVAANTDLGGFVFTGDGWQQLPAPPADTGFTAASVGALGINDFGAIAGGASNDATGDGSVGFVLAGGAYTFFSDPAYACTGARAIANTGLVIGTFGDCPSSSKLLGFVYNPGAAPGYPPGFTEIVPSLDGVPAQLTVVNQMNGLGQLVGSARIPRHLPRMGFVYDPEWRSHGLSDLFTFFRIRGLNTAARGINDFGRIVGFTTSPSSLDDNTGFIVTGLAQRSITCSQIAGAVLVTPQSINRSGVVTGQFLYLDDPQGVSHGFVAFPDPADDLADLLAAVKGAGPGASLEATLRHASEAVDAGNVGGACGALTGFLGELGAQSGKSIDAALATTLGTEAQAVAAEIGCR